MKIFTTRPDTLFGAKFMAMAPDHPLAQAAAKKNPALAEFIAECKRHGTAQEIIDKAEKLGFDTGIKAVHPFDPNWKLPVYVANFILMEYGTGAIFGCPATTSATSTSSTNITSASRRSCVRPGKTRRPSPSPTPPMRATAA